MNTQFLAVMLLPFSHPSLFVFLLIIYLFFVSSFPLLSRRKAVLISDAMEFGGHSRIDASTRHFSTPEQWDSCGNSLMVYLPTRTVTVYALEEDL